MERSSKRLAAGEAWRPPAVVIGIIDGIPEGAPAATAGPPPPAGNATAEDADGAASVQAVGTDNAPADVAWPIPAEMTGAPVPRPLIPVSVNALVPEPIPADWTAPSSLAAVVAALAAVAVLPAVNSLDSMLIGIDANFIGVLSSLSNAVEDDDDDVVSVAVEATALRLWGEERLCNACGIPEMSWGPDDMIVSASVVPEVAADWAVEATWVASPLGLVVCGGVVNGVTCDAVDEAPA